MKKMTALFALFIGLAVNAWAQQPDDVAAKRAYYESHGMVWPIQDAAPNPLKVWDPSAPVIDPATVMMQEFTANKEEWFNNDPARYNAAIAQLGITGAALAPVPNPTDQLMAEFLANKENWLQNDPARFNNAIAQLGLTSILPVDVIMSDSPIHISQSAYLNVDPEKRAYIDSHPLIYVVDPQ